MNEIDFGNHSTSGWYDQFDFRFLYFRNMLETEYRV